MTNNHKLHLAFQLTKNAGMMDSLKATAGSAFDKSKEVLGGAAKSIGDYQPFNGDNKWTSALGGAAGGALLGAGANGVRHLLGGTGEDSTLMGSLMNGGLAGAGLGGVAGFLGGHYGSRVGGHLGEKKLRSISGIDEMPDEAFAGPEGRAAAGDSIGQLGKAVGSGISQEMTIRDILNAIQNGGLDYNDLGTRMVKKQTGL